MVTQISRRDEIAKRYARALLDLAQKEKVLQETLKEVQGLAEVFKKEKSLWEQSVSPIVSEKAQQALIEKLGKKLHLSDLLRRFLGVLCENRRLPNLPSILSEFLIQTQEAEGVLEGVVESAQDLQKRELADLERSLKESLGQKVVLQQKANKDLLGGVIVRIGSFIVDTSTRSKLRKLEQVMKG